MKAKKPFPPLQSLSSSSPAQPGGDVGYLVPLEPRIKHEVFRPVITSSAYKDEQYTGDGYEVWYERLEDIANPSAGVVSTRERLDSTPGFRRAPQGDGLPWQSNPENLQYEHIELELATSPAREARSVGVATSIHNTQTNDQLGHQSNQPGLVPSPPSSTEFSSPLITGTIDQSTGFNNGIDEGEDDGLPRPVALPGKVGVLYPGSTTIYPAPFQESAVGSDVPSPAYSTRDPNSQVVVSANESLPATQYNHSSRRSTLSESSNVSHHSLEKPPEIAAESLDADGFTPEERAEHVRSVRNLRNLKIIAFTRLLLRTVAIVITLIAMILSAVILYHFHKARKTHALPKAISNRPTSALAGFGGITTLISLILLLLCLFMPRLRRVNTLSNVIFATISIIGVASWVCGCIYLYDGRGAGRNLWYYTCSAAKAYGIEEAAQGSHAEKADPDDAINERLVRMCSMTNGAWRLAVVASVLEIFTFLNVLLATVVVRGGFSWSLVKWQRRRRMSPR